jgi:transcriptional regulator
MHWNLLLEAEVYIPSAFAETRSDVLARFIAQYSFGTLVTSDASGGLCASHLPLLYDAGEGSKPAIIFSHMAKANPQWKFLRPETEVLVIFTGPHAYISPRWYEAKLAVPTWNYTAVHVYGRPRLIDDPKLVRQILSQTVEKYEGTGPGAWFDADLPEDFMSKMASAIVAFAIDVTRIEGKFKLNQNRSSSDRRGVIAALEAAGPEDSRAIADLMRAALADADSKP